ncbi:MAG: RNA polymerase-binding transcription factor DksA [Planctomycetota bacterium]|jgi:RNA polymerase-binding transcription factor DksA
MNEQDVQLFKDKLLLEKIELTNQLQGHGHMIDDSGDWAAAPPAVPDEDDANYKADRMEEFGTSVAIVTELEQRYVAVTDALKRIDEETYGLSTVSSLPIERERLDADPAAATTIDEMKGA